MSLWSIDIQEADGNLFAYVRVQNEWTGNRSGAFRRIYTDKFGRTYFKADGQNHYIDVQSYLDRQEHIKTALEFYKKYHGTYLK